MLTLSHVHLHDPLLLDLRPEIPPMREEDRRKGKQINHHIATNVQDVHEVIIVADPLSHGVLLDDQGDQCSGTTHHEKVADAVHG